MKAVYWDNKDGAFIALTEADKLSNRGEFAQALDKDAQLIFFLQELSFLDKYQWMRLLKNTEREEFDINFIRKMPNDNIDKFGCSST